MKDEVFMAYVTKHALTEGVQHIEVEKSHDSDYAYSREAGHGWQFGPKDWHRTESSAKFRAEEMRVKKIKSLKKQIDKLEKMRFGA